MQVIVQGQQVDVGEALRGYVQEKLTDTCTKFFSHSIQGNVHFAREANGYRTDITLSVGNGILLKASANDPQDPYPAFDQANTRLAKQLKRYKDRLRDHHTRLEKGDFPLPTAANEYTLEQDDDAVAHGEGGKDPVILAELPTTVPTMAVADAVMRMDLADVPAYLFRNAKHGRLNMVYRRKDGNVGWVDPQDQT
jgi:ribosomal subunit interface protein